MFKAIEKARQQAEKEMYELKGESMDKNEVKKELYKGGYIAELTSVRQDGILYAAKTADKDILFLIPLREIGEVIWEKYMPGKYLIRWLQD